MAIAHSKGSFYALVNKFPNRKQILVEGDSWVGHPLLNNLTMQLNKYLRGRCNLFSIGEIGHLAIDMMSGYQLRYFISVIRANQYDFDAIFMSAGGNDILDHNNEKYQLDKLLVNAGGNNYQDYIDQALWSEVLETVIEAYRILINTRDTYKPGCPIVTHTYDYIYPRDKGSRVLGVFSNGPWVYPAMMAKGIINQVTQREIIKIMLHDFKVELMKLQLPDNNFYVVDTQKTLKEHPNWGNSVAEWDDEIHPDDDGFKRIMYEKIGPKIKQLL
jgi:hypothetical protein